METWPWGILLACRQRPAPHSFAHILPPQPHHTVPEPILSSRRPQLQERSFPPTPTHHNTPAPWTAASASIQSSLAPCWLFLRVSEIWRSASSFCSSPHTPSCDGDTTVKGGKGGRRRKRSPSHPSKGGLLIHPAKGGPSIHPSKGGGGGEQAEGLGNARLNVFFSRNRVELQLICVPLVHVVIVMVSLSKSYLRVSPRVFGDIFFSVSSR